VIGSVMGTYSYHTKYIWYPTSTTACGSTSSSDASVIMVGWSNVHGIPFAPTSGGAFNCTVNICGTESSACFSIYNDTSIYNGSNTGNLMLWGNYAACNGDAACNAVRWQSTENASGASTYPGLSSPSESLPASFYYSSKPAWWPYNIPWPPIGPDVSGGSVANVGGHVYLTPSANCYLNIMGGSTNGSTGLLTFNANTCYPPAPTILQAAPH
jgi:hypothetical protein